MISKQTFKNNFKNGTGRYNHYINTWVKFIARWRHDDVTYNVTKKLFLSHKKHKWYEIHTVLTIWKVESINTNITLTSSFLHFFTIYSEGTSQWRHGSNNTPKKHRLTWIATIAIFPRHVGRQDMPCFQQ